MTTNKPSLVEFTDLVHPCSGAPITQHWGQNESDYARFGLWGHNGMDFATPMSTPILAIADGEVMMVDEDPTYGRYVRIYHAGLCCHSFYAHLSAQSVVVGQMVAAGQPVGQAGNTGNSTGPHLHLEIRLGERNSYSLATPMGKGRIDPETFFAVWEQLHAHGYSSDKKGVARSSDNKQLGDVSGCSD